MTQFNGASGHPLLADWMADFMGHEYTWASEWRQLAARGMSLACNDPFISALINAAMQVTLGPCGLRLQSLYDSNTDIVTVSPEDHKTRRVITSICERTWYGKDIDAEGARNRREIEEKLLWMSWAIGEGFAVRVWKDGASAWRIISPERVANPLMTPNTSAMRDGFRIGSSGRIEGIYIDTSEAYSPTGVYSRDKMVYVPWFASDGTPNVIHRKGFSLPGMMRGVTRLAPMIVLSRQLGNVLESHVAAKRLQAVHGMIVEAEDEEEFKAAQATGDALDPYRFQVKGPLNIWVKRPGTTVDLPKTEFSGDDLTAYCRQMYMIQCAAVGMPIDVVLCNLGDASLSSARAGLDQLDRLGQTEQEQHISECTGVIDRVAISDQIAQGSLSLSTDDWSQIMAGKYTRPPRFSTDALKDANTVKALIEAGFSKTTAMQRVGGSFEDESELKVAESEFEKAHGINVSPVAGTKPTPAPTDSGSASPTGDPRTPVSTIATARDWLGRVLKRKRTA